ncbi:OmpA family protein [Vibrio cincinnatiensis]|uniref:OmpA family protein n=1 Tax=Vibrio cincinnatiensis TaxID=675 RepID=UPI001EE07E92|nr:OmpA family protein [Vibrio cincinnatiensis]MCG3729727.1 OmpA family protein [Vibrio cincinnatiensis]
MKITVKTLFIVLVLVASTVVTATEQPTRQNALHYYCNNPDLEFELQVQVAEGRRVHLNQGAFPQIEDQERYSANFTFVEQQMRQAGIQGECVEYLLSHAKSSVTPDSDLLARVYFSFDRSELTDSSRYILAQIIERLQHDQTLKVEGHTDNIGSDEYNFSLGLRRAQSVTAYLQQQSNQPIYTEVISYGERKPLSRNDTAQGRTQNRRVDIY